MDSTRSGALDPVSPLGWGLVVAAILVSSAAATLLAARPIDPHRAAGVFPPWWSGGAVLEAASRAGAVVGLGTFPFVVVVQTSRSNAAERLNRAGALFAIDARYARLCGGEQS